jgi:hypothetical protein
MSCDPTVNDTICAPTGYFCQSINLSDGGIAGTCVLPGDQDFCLDSLGCAPGFFCVPYGGGPSKDCVQGCTQSSDCTDVYKHCVPQLISASQAGCAFNLCGPGSNFADGGSINGTDFNSPCDSNATSDGTCIPFFTTDPPTEGRCAQGGTIAQNEPCSLVRGDAGIGNCVVGDLCVILNVNVGGVFQNFSACLPVCSTDRKLDGGPFCDSTARCTSFTDEGAACFENCLLSNPTCPSPLVCLNIGDPTNGICGPG